MIKDKAIATAVNSLLLEYGAKLDESLSLVKSKCPPEEFVAYRKSVGKILGEMLEVMNPIYTQHPDLKPKDFE